MSAVKRVTCAQHRGYPRDGRNPSSVLKACCQGITQPGRSEITGELDAVRGTRRSSPLLPFPPPQRPQGPNPKPQEGGTVFCPASNNLNGTISLRFPIRGEFVPGRRPAAPAALPAGHCVPAQAANAPLQPGFGQSRGWSRRSRRFQEPQQ